MIEMLLYGRGGQGVVTAGELIVKAAVKKDFYGQSVPFFGGERRGAPVSSYVRLDSKPITIHRQTYNPDIVVLFETGLLSVPGNPIGNLKEEGKALINTQSPVKLGNETYYIDANEIARKTGLVIAGWPIVNTALAGAMAKVLGLFTIDALNEAIKGTFTGNIAESNLKAAEMGYAEVRKLE
ncbi:MAG: 2-oxoacid:acceptor oxidoreductase family protein [Candidatus Micrarchaeia archaeon]